MINNAIERFSVHSEEDPFGSYTVYYKNKNGSCYCYQVNYDKRGLAIINPNRRISSSSYEAAKPSGLFF